MTLWGEETQYLAFNTYFYKNKRPFDLTGCTADFSVVSTNNRMGTPILTKTMTAKWNDAGTAGNVLSVTLDPLDTVELYGKYIYEIQIRDADGDIEIPKQGVLYIANNINKRFIRQ